MNTRWCGFFTSVALSRKLEISPSTSVDNLVWRGVMNIKCFWKRIQIDYQNILRCLSLKGSEVVLSTGEQMWKKEGIDVQSGDFAKQPGYILLYCSGCRLPWEAPGRAGNVSYSRFRFSTQISLCAGAAALPSLLAGRERSLLLPWLHRCCFALCNTNSWHRSFIALFLNVQT